MDTRQEQRRIDRYLAELQPRKRAREDDVSAANGIHLSGGHKEKRRTVEAYRAGRFVDVEIQFFQTRVLDAGVADGDLIYAPPPEHLAEHESPPLPSGTQRFDASDFAPKAAAQGASSRAAASGDTALRTG